MITCNKAYKKVLRVLKVVNGVALYPTILFLRLIYNRFKFSLTLGILLNMCMYFCTFFIIVHF
jgi:hypothetical protein